MHLRPQARRGLTLIELLVVIGVIAILLTILMPAVARIRRDARDVVCLSRLRGLANASLSYKTQYRRFPQPPPPSAAGGTGGVLSALLPLQKIDRNLLNQLAPFAGYHTIKAGVPAIDLPTGVQSPEVEAMSDDRGPLHHGGTVTYYTGFVYPAALYDPAGQLLPSFLPSLPQLPIPPPPLPSTKTLPIPSLPNTPLPGSVPLGSASARKGMLVLWADNLHLGDSGVTGQPLWEFTHARPDAEPGQRAFTYTSGSGCRGIHRVNADMSGEWVPLESLNLTPTVPDAPGELPVRIGTDYWWF